MTDLTDYIEEIRKCLNSYDKLIQQAADIKILKGWDGSQAFNHCSFWNLQNILDVSQKVQNDGDFSDEDYSTCLKSMNSTRRNKL